jgi:hypothetical protein
MIDNKCITYGSRQFALFLPHAQKPDAQQKKGQTAATVFRYVALN